jgi:fatty-acyl-CoA synthase
MTLPKADPTLNRAALASWIRALDYKTMLQKGPNVTLLSVIGDGSRPSGDSLALLDETSSLSYRNLIHRSNFYAQWAIEQQTKRGEAVCVMMPNSANYVAVWLGITHAGRIAALINANLFGEALTHSIRISGARHIIVDGSLRPAVDAILRALPQNLRVWVHTDGQTDDDPNVLPVPPAPAAPAMPIVVTVPPSRHERALLIYTSGTTGAPKGAYVSHARILEWSAWFAGMMNAQPTDRLYNCLPMYHSVGGVVAIGSMLVRGGAVVIRSRFSASRFWDDIVKNDCTIFQYIGELCRYLTRSPVHPLQALHRLRLCCGNGMRGDVWEEFQARFRIPRVLEFYAATEGNVSLYNCEGKPGAIGRIPPFLANAYPVELIRSDVETGEPVRGPDGFCIRCANDEAGEAIGPIKQDSVVAARHFDGYTDAHATSLKILRDVFKPGDGWFRTGDLMRKDNAGYYYFVDRLGDTFRWKGENVSTQEVASVIGACPGVVDVVVYGVEIPGTEGRAGMAALTTDNTFTLERLRTHLIEHLPNYARPLLLRLCRTIPITGTFKLTKGQLLQEGLVPSGDETVWFNDRDRQSFVRLDGELLHRISNGELNL